MELQAGVTDVEAWAWQTRAETVGVMTMVELEGRRSPPEPERWRVEVQLLTWKSEVEPE